MILFSVCGLVAPDGSKYLTPKNTWCISYLLDDKLNYWLKKISIPKDNTFDYRTGQPTGDKGGKVSYMELQMLSAQGLDNTVTRAD